MADDALPPKAGGPVFVEQIPSVEGGTSGLASSVAPFIFCDGVATMGHYNGIAHLSLSALRFMPAQGAVRSDSVVVVHLRMNMIALGALKDAISKIELLAQPVPDGAKN